jgi:hypothetical protein
MLQEPEAIELHHKILQELEVIILALDALEGTMIELPVLRGIILSANTLLIGLVDALNKIDRKPAEKTLS